MISLVLIASFRLGILPKGPVTLSQKIFKIIDLTRVGMVLNSSAVSQNKLFTHSQLFGVSLLLAI